MARLSAPEMDDESRTLSLLLGDNSENNRERYIFFAANPLILLDKIYSNISWLNSILPVTPEQGE